MMCKITLSNDFFIEKLIITEDTLDIATKIDLPKKYVCFFLDYDRGTEDSFSGYVQYNKEQLERSINNLGYEFFIISNKISSKKGYILNFYKALVYHFPFLDIPDLHFFDWLNRNNRFSLGQNSLLLNYYKTSKNWSGGFLCHNEGDLSFFPTSYSDLTSEDILFFEYERWHNFSNEQIEQAVSQYIYHLGAENDLKVQLDDRELDKNIVLYSPPEGSLINIDDYEDIAPSPKSDNDSLFSPPLKADELELLDKLDEETLQKIKEIEDNIEHLKKSGNFVFIAPLLESFLKENNLLDKIKEPPYNLYISPSDFRITIPDLNVEIKMNALTKAVYFLFLSCGKGIAFDRLPKYKHYLLNIYLAVSNKTDVNAMRASVEGVVDIDTKLIYMHISRIKSAFLRQFSDDVASYYYLQGARGGEKYILLDIDRQTNINSFINIWGRLP